MENKIDNQTTETKSQKFMRISRNVFLVILLLALPIIYFWKNYEINKLNDTHNSQIADIKAIADSTINKNTKKSLIHLSKAYVWAIRKEMMNKNIEQLNLYANDMVKEKNFQNIMICNDKGIIISATNKKYEGKHLGNIMDAIYLQANETTINFNGNASYRVISPIMGFNSKLGTLIIDYQTFPLIITLKHPLASNSQN